MFTHNRKGSGRVLRVRRTADNTAFTKLAKMQVV
jgi:hypothetical protein